MLSMEDIGPFATKLAGATARTVHDYASGEIRHEEPFSGELSGRLKETLQDFETENVTWQVDIVAQKKGRARLMAASLSKYDEEPEFGADLVFVIDIEMPDYRVKKGFLVQSKRLEVGANLPEAERKRLVEQCERMLAITQDAFVFLYSKSGVTPLRANAVVAAEGRNLYSLPTYNIATVYADFALCWVGDRNIEAADRRALEVLRERVNAESAILFRGRALKRADPVRA
jgi:hypothetical protein